MGTIKRILLSISTFFQVVYTFLGAMFAPFKGFFSFLGTCNSVLADCMAACPDWLAGLALFSVTIGVICLILGRK